MTLLKICLKINPKGTTMPKIQTSSTHNLAQAGIIV